MPPRTADAHPRLTLADLPHDLINEVAALLPPAERFHLALVAKTFSRALRPPCAAWQDIAIGPGTVQMMALVAERQEPVTTAAAAAMAPASAWARAFIAAAPALRRLSLVVGGDADAAATAAALAALLGTAGNPPRPALSPALQDLRVVWKASAAAAVDSGALATVFGARSSLTSLDLTLCRPPSGGHAEWAPRLEALAAVRVSPALRALTIQGNGREYRSAERPHLLQEDLSVLTVLASLVSRATNLRQLTVEDMEPAVDGSTLAAWRSLGSVTRVELKVMFRSRPGGAGVRRPLLALPDFNPLAGSVRELRVPAFLIDGDRLDSFLAACAHLTSLDVVGDVKGEYVDLARGVPGAVLQVTGLRSLSIRVLQGFKYKPWRHRVGATFETHDLSALSSLTSLVMHNTGVKKLSLRQPQGVAQPTLASLVVLDARESLIDSLPPLRAAAPSLRVLKLGAPAWEAMCPRQHLEASHAARGAALGRAGRAAEARKEFDLSDLGGRVRAFPASLTRLEFRNAHFTLVSTERVVRGLPAGAGSRAIAAEIARAMATRTAPGLRRLVFENVSTANPILRDLLADGGAVLWAAYTPRGARESSLLVEGEPLWGHPVQPPPPRPPSPPPLEAGVPPPDMPPQCRTQ